MIDPMKLTEVIRKKFMKKVGNDYLAPYWRFRGGHWYGGVATGDVVGCNLCCKFCGPRLFMVSKQKFINFKKPEEVARILLKIAKKRNYRYLRISGGEPTIYKEHLLQLLDILKHERYIFILETNGILLGADKSYADVLSEYPNLHIRVSLKGADEREFENLTMAPAKYFEIQLQALRNLLNTGVSFHPAVVASFNTNKDIAKLKKRLEKIDPELPKMLEVEYIVLYPHVIKSLKHYKLVPTRAYTTDWELIGSEEFKRRFLRVSEF